MTWIYFGQPFEDPDKWYGFVYRITHIPTGKHYLGRKYFHLAATKMVKGKKKKYRKESDWKTYYGSSKHLQADIELFGAHEFKREIIRLCKSRTECSYYETRYIFTEDALLSDMSYNRWVSCKITEMHIRSLAK